MDRDLNGRRSKERVVGVVLWDSKVVSLQINTADIMWCESCGSDRPRSETYVRRYLYIVYGSQSSLIGIPQSVADLFKTDNIWWLGYSINISSRDIKFVARRQWARCQRLPDLFIWGTKHWKSIIIKFSTLCSLARRRPRKPNAMSHYSHLSSPRKGVSRLLPEEITNEAPHGELSPRLLSIIAGI